MIIFKSENPAEQEILAKMAVVLVSGSGALEKLAQLPNFESYSQIVQHFIDAADDGDWLSDESPSHQLWLKTCGIEPALEAYSAGEALSWAYDKAHAIYFGALEQPQAQQ
ncbi:hypothetical protein [Conchiformibius steedae]|uniref:hypothetical protein n=1 Tax=Conchiformibius steedae TaxID=153493 RepID=UPI0026ECEE46|nr:hypothetical protein [Conchiformibius steedae]